MKRICIITCSINSNSFTTSFYLEHEVPEYVLADEAWRVALLFAQTQAIAALGCCYSSHQFAKFMEDLKYDYIIKEEK